MTGASSKEQKGTVLRNNTNQIPTASQAQQYGSKINKSMNYGGLGYGNQVRQAMYGHTQYPQYQQQKGEGEAKQGFSAKTIVQKKLTVGSPDDHYEKEADAVADQVMQMPEPALQRKCIHCEAEQESVQRKPLSSVISPVVQAKASKESTVNESVSKSLQQSMGGGTSLKTDTKNFMENRFGADFSQVRIHTGPQAIQLSKQLHAQAFTTGNHIYFNEGKYVPESSQGRHLLAHELTHTVQQTGNIQKKSIGGLSEELDYRVGIGGIIQRDLATEPPQAGAEAVILSEAEMRAAIAWNRRRFHDPYNIMNVRDVLGIEKYPAVIDEDFVNALLQWQADFGLPQDGKMGATTTATLLAELNAEGMASDASTLSVDNTVDTVDVVPRTYNTPAVGLPFEFNWQVAFRTTLRNGFIIQLIENTFNASMCGGGTYTGWQPIPRYWEAWRVDANGNVTPMISSVNDMFTRPLLPGSQGTWVMRGTLYTTRTLPANFVAGSVQDAGILRATLSSPGSDFLGYVAARRRVGGTWNSCGGASTHTAN